MRVAAGLKIAQVAQDARALFPGVLMAATIGLAAKFLSEHYGAPVMLMALLLGMAFSFLTEEEDNRARRGIEFSSKAILRFGVALLGLGITVQQVRSLGSEVIFITLFGVAFTLLLGPLLARIFGLRTIFGILVGGAVAICGASAALAIASVLPKHGDKERDTIFAVVSVTVLSTLAMIIYPIIVDGLSLSDRAAGVFLGSTIHDVAQVVGAGYSISEEVGDTATLVKLLRVSLLVPIVIIISVFFATKGSALKGAMPVPPFVIGFVCLVFVGSYHLVPEDLAKTVLTLSRWCLITAISALGMKTSLKKFIEVGGSSVGLVFGLTVLLALFSISIILFLKI
ncbi:MAG TPA: putative sulfate exporter family transporter [Hyphomicrobiales bacterium]|nr:putative sulfate exporter family transporter [Hyphomicrobiales bacterium]